MSTNSCCSSVEEKIANVKTKTIREFYDSVAGGMGPYKNKTAKFSPSVPTDWIVNKILHSQNHTRIMAIGCGMGTTYSACVLNLFTRLGHIIVHDRDGKIADRMADQLAGQFQFSI